MSEKEIVARHYATRQPMRVKWRDGVITSVTSASDAPEDQFIAPSLIDLQVNGFAGVDFQQDDVTAEQLLTAVRGLRAAGCARFLLTLITDDWGRLMKRLRRLHALREGQAELGAAIIGWHIEGPFLSAEPGFCGAHDPRHMRDGTPKDVAELRETVGGDFVLLTLAPERAGNLEVIRAAIAHGIKVSLGHTNASADQLVSALEAGAAAFTHLGNGCPQALDRHDNILWRVFDLVGKRGGQSFYVSVIPDSVHVSPALFRLANHALGDRIFYVSDAMSAAGAPSGRHRLGPLELEVGADRIVRFPGRNNFAGSALRPVDGVLRAAAMLGCPWPEAWRRFSETPAQLLGLSDALAAGSPADFYLVKEVHNSASPGSFPALELSQPAG